MANFDDAITYVLFNENGGVDHGVENSRSDRGGATRFGITHNEAALHGRNVATLTLDQAKAIYRSDYWKFDGIREQSVATKLLDVAVNCGLSTAIMIAQRQLGAANVDGIIGPRTVDLINSAPAHHVLQLLALGVADHYCDITRGDVMHRIQDGKIDSIRRGESDLENLKGWVRRAIRIPLAALILLAGCATHVGMIDTRLLDDPQHVIAASHANDPTPEHPRVGCIQPTMAQQVSVPGKLLPEIVRIIGYTSDEDGRRLKVLRAGQFDPSKWQPWPESAISYVRCGPEAEAYGAEQRTPDERPKP